MPGASTESQQIVRVALVPPQGEIVELDYLFPSSPGTTPVGCRVVVPLGRRRAIGVVVRVLEESPHTGLRPVDALIDREPLFDAVRIRLCRWIADYYLAPLGDVLATALPGSLRLRLERVVSRVAEGADSFGEAERRLLEHLDARGGTCRLADLRAQLGGVDVSRRVKHLAAAGVVRVEERMAGEYGRRRMVEEVSLARHLSAEEAVQLRRRRPALYAVYECIQARGGGPVAVKEINPSIARLRTKVRQLAEMKLVRVQSVEPSLEAPAAGRSSNAGFTMTPEQAAAVAAVRGAVEAGVFAPFLLLGVTGSGKTEVYLRAIECALRRRRGALVLVPEISLTHQLVERVRGRFRESVAVLHSGLSTGERWEAWQRLARGAARVAVGARSAVFAPVRDLGLVVVDEEHDAAYKQAEGVRYNGRDVAVMRAQLTACPVVLGSATPAMESFENGCRGRYRLVELRQRVEGRPLPAVEIVDLRRRLTSVEHGIPVAPELQAALRANHVARGQSLVFLNRRGFANFLQCCVCGETMMCPNCSVALTLHLRRRVLRCHHCGYQVPQPVNCPGCAERTLVVWGAGTERVEQALARIVPGARIGRMDRDTTSRRGAQRRLLRAWETRRFDILVGTQMIAKGHDVPGVTFVAALLADQSLNFPDFRAAERTFQLLTQVAGRAGRGDRAGRVVVQTFQPHHYSLRCAATHDFRGFAARELEYRRETGYPPFSRLVLFRCEGLVAARVEAVARRAAEHARAQGRGAQVLGPAPAPLERVRGRYQWQLLLRSQPGGAARRAAAAARDAVRGVARREGVRLTLDVDPYFML